jgi:hypothetical protein
MVTGLPKSAAVAATIVADCMDTVTPNDAAAFASRVEKHEEVQFGLVAVMMLEVIELYTVSTVLPAGTTAKIS